jgi:hypothetical protein
MSDALVGSSAKRKSKESAVRMRLAPDDGRGGSSGEEGKDDGEGGERGRRLMNRSASISSREGEEKDWGSFEDDLNGWRERKGRSARHERVTSG